jgi:hypothetical protein
LPLFCSKRLTGWTEHRREASPTVATLDELKKTVARKIPWATNVRDSLFGRARGTSDAEAQQIPLDFVESLPSLPEVVYLRDQGTNPDALAAVPISKLRRQSLGLRVADPDVNPYTRTVRDYLDGKATSYDDSILKPFHMSWQPKTLAEFLGLEAAADSELNQPLTMDRLPWQPYHGAARLQRDRDEREARQMEKFGLPESGWHGVCHFGPTSKAVGEHRFVKHCRLAREIRDRGYEPLPHIEVQLLASSSDWVAVVRDGKHRSTALASLGVQEVVVSLSRRFPVVRREDVDVWPGVTTRLFTREEALQVFDRFVVGDSPRGFPDVAALQPIRSIP